MVVAAPLEHVEGARKAGTRWCPGPAVAAPVDRPEGGKLLAISTVVLLLWLLRVVCKRLMPARR